MIDPKTPLSPPNDVPMLPETVRKLRERDLENLRNGFRAVDLMYAWRDRALKAEARFRRLCWVACGAVILAGALGWLLGRMR